MKVSLIVPIYNVELYIEEFLNSLVHQNIGFENHVELILVNDGSTDSSGQKCQDWQKLYPNNVKYIYKENGGVSSARNIGIENASCEWISFPDPDDCYDLDYLGKIIEVIENNSNIDYLVSNMFFYSKKGKLKPKHLETNNIKILKQDYHSYVKKGYVNSVFFKKSIITKNKIKFNELLHLTQDAIFTLNYLKHSSLNTAFVNTKYFYREHEMQNSNNKSKKAKYFIALLKYGYLPLINEEYSGMVKFLIQESIIYHIINWVVKLLCKNNLIFENQYEEKELLYLLKKVISYVPFENYKNISLFSSEFSMGVYNYFSGGGNNLNYIEINYFNPKSMILEILYNSQNKDNIDFYTIKRKVVPNKVNISANKIAGDILYYQHTYQVHLNKEDLIYNISAELANVGILNQKINKTIYLSNTLSLEEIIKML